MSEASEATAGPGPRVRGGGGTASRRARAQGRRAAAGQPASCAPCKVFKLRFEVLHALLHLKRSDERGSRRAEQGNRGSASAPATPVQGGTRHERPPHGQEEWQEGGGGRKQNPPRQILTCAISCSIIAPPISRIFA